MAAVLTLSGVDAAWAAGASPIHATPQEKAQAQTHYETGTKAFEERRFAEALSAFQASYAVVASPNSHLMMARSMRELDQLASAYEEFDRTEREAKQLLPFDAPRYGPTVEKAATDRDALRKRVALVTVRVRGDGVSVTVGNRSLASEQIGRPLAVMPGSVDIVGTATDGRRVAKTATTVAGASLEVDIDLSQPVAPLAPVPAPAPAPPPPAPAPAPDTVSPAAHGSSLLPYAIVAGGVGVVGLGVGTAFGVMHLSTYSTLEDKCPPTRRPCDRLQGEIDTGRTQQTIANVGLVVGGVGLGAGAVLLVMDLSRRGARQTDGGTTPAVSVGYRTVSVSGRF